MNIKPVLFTALLGAGLALGMAPHVQAAMPENRSAVHDKFNQVVRSTQGYCVRTSWVESSDDCAPAPQAQLAQAVPPTKPMQITEIHQIPDQHRTVYFEFARSDLLDSERRKLDNLATTLKQMKEINGVRIVGYADRIGTPNYNVELSSRRARVVEDYLRERGYLKTTIAQTRWLGETASVTRCSANLSHDALINCLQSDRRVTVEVKYQNVASFGRGMSR